MQGRTFSYAGRQGAPLVVIINQTLGHRFFPGQNPVGMRLRQNRENPWMEIAGVVGDVRYSGLAVPAIPALYVLYRQHAWPGIFLVVRSTGDPLALAAGRSDVLRMVVRQALLLALAGIAGGLGWPLDVCAARRSMPMHAVGRSTGLLFSVCREKRKTFVVNYPQALNSPPFRVSIT